MKIGDIVKIRDISDGYFNFEIKTGDVALIFDYEKRSDLFFLLLLEQKHFGYLHNCHDRLRVRCGQNCGEVSRLKPYYDAQILYINN